MNLLSLHFAMKELDWWQCMMSLKIIFMMYIYETCLKAVFVKGNEL